MNRTDKIRKMIEVLPEWYQNAGRQLPWREKPSPYHVWISEIMLQQTRIETVIPYYRRFLSEIPDITHLAEADPEHLHKLWEGLGYYSRVRNLQTAAKQIMTQFGGHFPETYEDIRSLCGIGDYTAGAIASICFDLPQPAVDGNVLRVLARITEDSRPINSEKLKKEIRTELASLYPSEKCGVLTQAIMELGETVCLPNGLPNCADCPCRYFCGTGQNDPMHYPIKEAKKERKVEQLTVFLLTCNGLTAIRKRPAEGLLSGLWEFPNCPEHLSEADTLHQAEIWGCQHPVFIGVKSNRHVFTHIEWNIRCYTLSCDSTSDLFTWVSDQQLDDEIPLPTAFRKLLK